MKCSMTGQEKGDLNTGDCLIEVTAWACLTVIAKRKTNKQTNNDIQNTTQKF